MYRDGCQYDKMAILVGEIFIDYNIKTFPLDANDWCKKLGIKLIPYSEYPTEARQLLLKRSESGFYSPITSETPPMIFYNDDLSAVGSFGNMRRNIIHETIHYVKNATPEDEKNDDLCDYAGKYALAPIPYLIAKNINNINTIISDFGVDFTMAGYIYKNLCNRRTKYGNRIFEYEKPLLYHLLGNDYDVKTD